MKAIPVILILLTCLAAYANPLNVGNDESNLQSDIIWAGIELNPKAEDFDSTNVEKSFLMFIQRIADLSESDRNLAVESLVATAAADSNAFNLILDLTDKHLGNIDSPLHNDLLYIPFLVEIMKYPILENGVKERLKFLLDMARKNCPGKIAADFRFTDRDGNDSKLSGVDLTRRALLIFYDPDCHHCHETFDLIKSSHLSEAFQIIAIDAEEDRSLWDASKNDFPDDWIVGFATDPIQDSETYVFQTMPAVYMLDRDKTIILKDASINQVNDYIGQ